MGKYKADVEFNTKSGNGFYKNSEDVKSYTFYISSPKNDDEKSTYLVLWIYEDLGKAALSLDDAKYLAGFTSDENNNSIQLSIGGNISGFAAFFNLPKKNPKDSTPLEDKPFDNFFVNKPPDEANLSFQSGSLFSIQDRFKKGNEKQNPKNLDDYIDYYLTTSTFVYSRTIYQIVIQSESDLAKYDLPENKVTFSQNTPETTPDTTPETTPETQGSQVEKVDGLFTFNVERENKFIIISNPSGVPTSDIGELILETEQDGFIFQDDFEQLDELDPEFTETDFDGLDEEEFKLQDEITNNINDQEQLENLQTNNETGVKVDIQPVSSFDELLRLAGKLARELGKNGRVKYENLRKGYTKGIHGLCPQGTQAVLYALTGVKALGQISGNADWFSFKNPGTGGGPASFSKTGHYKDKVRITQKNNSWKGTYIQDPSQWQIGDIIVMGYTGGKKYGHIQIWTGVNWMSDFKQNKIQQNHVDPNTVALWRLSDKGIAALKAQSGNIGKQIS